MTVETHLEGQARLTPRLESSLQQAQRVLEVILGRSVDTVKAIWTIRQDEKGRIVVRLDLFDLVRRPLAVCSDFSPEELSDLDHLRQRLRFLWGDLLQAQLEEIGKDLKSILAAEGGRSMTAANIEAALFRLIEGHARVSESAENFKDLVSESTLAREKLAIKMEDALARRDQQMAEISTALALIRKDLDDLKSRSHEAGRNRWALLIAVLSAVLSLGLALLVALIKKP